MKITQKISGAALVLSLALCGSYGFSGGDGTEGNPWLISTPQELASLSQYTGEAGSDKYFALANDITFGGADFSAAGDFYNEGKLWEPIGPTENAPFKGNLDGHNFTISGLKLNRVSDSFAGLFGVIEESTICNLTVNYASPVTSSWRSAGVAGIAKESTASNISINADISIKTKAYGGERAGGIFGSTTGDIRIENCQVTGTIKGDNPMRGILGGIIGHTSDFVEISYCDVEAEISNVESAGGIIGKDSAGSRITGCQFSGNMFGNYYFGGMIGDASYVRDDYTTFSNTFQDCSVDADISANAPDNYGSSFVGGMVGYSVGRYLTFNNCTYAGSLRATAPSGEACIGGMIGVGSQCVTRLEKCRSAGTIYGQVRGTASTWMGLDTVYAGGIAGYLSAHPKTGPLSVKSCYASMNITGDSVANIYVGGLLGAIIGADYAVAQMDDVVIGCGSDGKVTIKGTGASSYFLGAAGLVGRLEKVELSDCYALNHIVATSLPNYSLGSLVAIATSSSITRSHALGDLEAATVSNKTGTLGGILGKNVGSTVSQCVALPHILQGVENAEVPAPLINRVASGDATGLTQNYARGDMAKTAGLVPVPSIDDLNGPDGLGKTAEEVELQSTYEDLGWDFQTTWKMDTEGYPILTWNLPEPAGPSIVEQPQSVTTMEGESVTFGVKATGTEPLSYAWYWNGIHLLDYSGPTLTLESVSPNHVGEYIVHVNNQYGQAISEAAILTVIIPEPPTIVEQPQSLQVLLGQSATFSVTAAGTEPLTYQWFKDTAPLNGAEGSSYTIASATLNDAGVYTVQVSNQFGRATSEPARLSVTYPVPPPVITTQPQTLIIGIGSAATFAVVAQGENLTYQWYLNDEEIAGAAQPVYALARTSSADSGTYTVKVSNEVGEVMSEPAALWLNHLLIYAGVNVYGPVGAEFLVEYTLTPGNPQSWKELSKGVINALPTVVIDYDSPQDAKRFYRVILNDE